MPAPAAANPEDDISDPVARARAIAARLGLVPAGVLGKRKAEGDGLPWGSGEDAKKRTKIYLPTSSSTSYIGLLIGPKVRAAVASCYDP